MLRQSGQTLKQSRERGISLGQRAPDQRHAAKQARQIVEQALAQLHDLAIGEGLQERIYRFGPESERGAGGERIPLGHQTRHLAVAREQLAREPALARTGLAK